MIVRWQNSASSGLLQTNSCWYDWTAMASRQGSRGCLSRSSTTSTSTGNVAEKRVRLYCWVELCMCECALKGEQKRTTFGKELLGGKPAVQCSVAQCCSAFHFQKMEKCHPELRSRLGSALLWACDSAELQLQFPQLMCRNRLSPVVTALFLHMKPLITKAKSARSPSPGKLKKLT